MEQERLDPPTLPQKRRTGRPPTHGRYVGKSNRPGRPYVNADWEARQAARLKTKLGSALLFENELDYGTERTHVLVDWLMYKATDLFTDALKLASTPMQRTLQVLHNSTLPERMLDSLELLSCDAALREPLRHELAAMGRCFRRAHIKSGLPNR